MTDPRASERINPEDIVVLGPGQSAPPVLVVLDDGTVVTMDQFEQMESENDYSGDDEEIAQ